MSANRKPAPMPSSFETECLPHVGALYGLGMRLCRNHHDAEDLVQTTLISAMHTWDPTLGSSALSYLFKILGNEFINMYRKRQRHTRISEERPIDVLRVHAEQDPEDDGVADEVLDALVRLDPDYREVIERADLRGESYKAIAEALHIPPGTVMSRLYRARRLLESALGDYARTTYGIVKR